jgi:hypothetical protein
MRTALPHLDIPPTIAAEVAESTSDLFDALTLIGLAGEELSRMALRPYARHARVPRNRARLDRIARQNAVLDQLATLCHEIAGFHMNAELVLEDANLSRPAHEEPRIPPPPVGRPESDLALANLEAWWASCVPALIDSARTSAARIAEELRETGSAACLEFADRLVRFAAAEYEALTS